MQGRILFAFVVSAESNPHEIAMLPIPPEPNAWWMPEPDLRQSLDAWSGSRSRTMPATIVAVSQIVWSAEDPDNRLCRRGYDNSRDAEVLT